MALVYCDVTGCRFNGQQRCTLGEIAVAPGPVAEIAEVLGHDSSYYDGQLRAGYAEEFNAYVQYAETHPESIGPGALCRSYSPE